MKNILESNRLIAEFMGVVFYDDENQYYDSKEGEFIGTTLDYDFDWNWLMPVVEKINSDLKYGRPEIRIGFRTEVFYSPLTKDGDTVQRLSNSYPDGSIESVYKAVIQFIKWYNTNKMVTV